ncbi:MAG: polysaccharide pyruvyl transferase family protein [Ruminococcus flavefaciens]|nr:polysaccharide pyruvyl transferase family protein [Ruminococcus flavefaciens]
MRILLLSRPVINAGDYLFTAKSLEAFERLSPQTIVETGHISDEFELNYVNKFDAVIAAGGPLYDNRFLIAETFPVLKHIDNMLPKLHFMSGGWYGADAETSSLSSYRFAGNVMANLRKIQERGGIFSCRDFISEYILKNNGINNVTMIGCTAWYDYERLDMLEPLYHGNIKRIIISDQGITKDSDRWTWKYFQMDRVIKLLNRMFPKSELTFTFNGGICTKYSKEFNLKICDLLNRNNIPFYDISGDKKGFSLYDQADLHVGFRMHSHIYCMSKRIPSVLISEDARGIGLNTTIGLNDIRDFIVDEGKIISNDNMIKELEHYLENLMESKCQLLVSAYIRINTVYKNFFVPFVRRICSYDNER